MADSPELNRSLAQYLTSKNLPPDGAWLSSFLATAKLTTPLLALQKSVEYRLLASDFTHTLDKTRISGLPQNAIDATVKEKQLQDAVVFQLLDIEDIGRPRWAQIELIEQHERGETTRGREIIRTVRDSEDRGPQQPEPSHGPHKMLLQDAHGTKIYAVELVPIPGVGLGIGIGAKLLVRRATIARGLMLLEPSGVEVLGGKVTVWAEQWQKDRKQSLKTKLDMPTDSGG
ncbi:hypothetical protein ANO11243_012460 [Dothideomycetidae sp. 11243]|nr:hypothetical protein ANO11243_012460 [fungal sp. No.11243]